MKSDAAHGGQHLQRAGFEAPVRGLDLMIIR